MVAEHKSQAIELMNVPHTPSLESKQSNAEKPYLTISSSEIPKLAIEDSIINSNHRIRTVFKSQTSDKFNSEKPNKTNCM